MNGLVVRLVGCERRAWSVTLVAILGWLLGNAACAWQMTGGEDAIRQSIERGEFSRAVALVDQLPAERADEWRQQLVMAQRSHGAPEAAWHSLRSIVSSDRRDEVLQSWANDRQPNTGHRGGITEADFQELIRLIRQSIDPDSWQENGGDGTMEPFANGVYVDQSGTLHRARRDTTGRLELIRRRVAQQTPRSSGQVEESASRCVSLVRLERECQIHAVRGEPIPEILTNLAGLYRIDYLVVDREANDLILVGPAGPWSRDTDGRVVNTATGSPVLQLDDLVVCLRNARYEGGKFGCSIEPRPDRLAETQRFVETTRARGNALREQLAQHLGMQDVVVFGLPAESQAARVIVEADYLMKLVAVGLEPTVLEVPNYLDRLQAAAGQALPVEIARWWFTVDVDRLVTNDDRTVFEFQGTGVRLCSETEFLSRTGQRVHTGQANEATDGYARDFTKHFDKLAQRYPAFAHLRGIFDLALVAALVEHHGLGRHVRWKATHFVGSNPQFRPGEVYLLRTGLAPTQVASVVTQRTFSIGHGERQTVTAVSGGVVADFGRLVRDADYVSSDQVDDAMASATAYAPAMAAANWWWDR